MNSALNGHQRAAEGAAQCSTTKRFAPYAAECDADPFFPLTTLRVAVVPGFAAIYIKSDAGGSKPSRPYVWRVPKDFPAERRVRGPRLHQTLDSAGGIVRAVVPRETVWQ
ncbi:MAG: hypothetical protein KGJ79_05550 [Alphaproteobacteria bacterium]|nr:hypothetical protein [Alphaproteobacteria bacterium]MDE2110586.1 hypothetical protein [Alphaproteobacteria bacterium]MDE2492686.1 hypothetical protein [Alphaproteobacteria bacterium]